MSTEFLFQAKNRLKIKYYTRAREEKHKNKETTLYIFKFGYVKINYKMKKSAIGLFVASHQIKTFIKKKEKGVGTMSKTKKKIGLFLTAFFLIVSVVFGGLFFRPVQGVKAEETATETKTARYVNITSEELTYDGSMRSATGGNYVTNLGHTISAGTDGSATALVYNVPDDLVGTATMTFTDSAQVRKLNDGESATPRFRLVFNNKVIYPTDGGWADCPTASVVHKISDSVKSLTVKAGDRLYWIADNSTSVGEHPTWFRDLYCVSAVVVTYNGASVNLWSADTVNHINPENDSKTKEIYGGTYTHAQLLAYEKVWVSDMDYSAECTKADTDAHFSYEQNLPTFLTEEDGTPYISFADGWSSTAYRQPLNDYRLDLTFRYRASEVNTGEDFGIYFNCNGFRPTDGNYGTQGHILHFYMNKIVLYNTPNPNGWWTNEDIILQAQTPYLDGEWHTVSINSLGNKFFITVDGEFLLESVTNGDSKYADHTYTADSNFENTYIHLVGAKFDVKQFDITSYAYADESASAQFASVKSVYEKIENLNESDYDEYCWNTVNQIATDGVGKIMATANGTDASVALAEICAEIDSVPYKESELPKNEEVLIGYHLDGALYSPETELTGASPVYIKLKMDKGASVRISDPTGLRFTTQIETSYLENLKTLGVSYTLGTLIAKAEDITLDEAVDYSLLTVESSVKKLNIVSTVQKEKDGTTFVNGAVVGIALNHYDWDFAGRGYMTVSYADGSEGTFYAIENENARSVKFVAIEAYNDFSETSDEDYKYQTEYGYSRYTAEERATIGLFINDGEVFEPLTNEMKEETYMHVLDASRVSGADGGARFSVLFEYQDQVVMIDTGWKAEASTAYLNAYLRERGINRIDHLILSHFHADHAGGVPYILENYDVGTLYWKPFDFSYSSTGEADAEYYALALEAVQKKVNSDGMKVNVVAPSVEGYTVALSEDTSFSIYNCTELFEGQSLDGNAFSMQVHFKSGTASAHVGADATSHSDPFVLGNIGKVDVYTLQHHGTAGPYSSAELLAELSPTYCVASTSSDELDKNNGDEVYDTSDGQRWRAEAYGQVVNVHTDGTRYFKITDGHFVIQGDDETRFANAKKVKITETEIPYSATTGRASEDGNKVIGNGTQVQAGKTTSTALVLNVPQSFQGVATVTLSDSILYKISGNGDSRFRIVLNDKVVYPTEDGWLDFSASSGENKVLLNLRLTVKAGDKLYFIVDGAGTKAYLTMGMRIDGLWYDVTNVDHVNSANDNSPATKNFFNGKLYNDGNVYTRGTLISYMQVTVEDIKEAE